MKRKEFFELLHAEMSVDPDIWFLTADLGYGYAEKILRDYPDRALNVGIAEQLMIGIAKGLSDSGKKVFCYSMTAFLVYRPYELLRIISDYFYNVANVNIMLVGYEPAGERTGNTHKAGDYARALESINILTWGNLEEIIKPDGNLEYMHLEG